MIWLGRQVFRWHLYHFRHLYHSRHLGSTLHRYEWNTKSTMSTLMTATPFTFDTLRTETPLYAHIWLRRQKYLLWFITWHRYDRDSQKLCFFLFNFVFFLIFDTHMTETPSEYFKLKYVLYVTNLTQIWLRRSKFKTYFIT